MSKAGTVLKQGETESRSVSVNGYDVISHHVTQHGKGDSSQHVVMDWTFNFLDVDQDQLLKLATRGLLIDCRNAWKKQVSTVATSDEQTTQTFIVTELLTKQKRGKTVAEKVAALTSGMSAEQVEALIKQATSVKEA